MLLNCGVGEDSWESLGLQGDPTSPSQRRPVLGVHWKDWCWSWNSNTLATWCGELTHWKRPWCWEGLGAGGEGDGRGWDGWMAAVHGVSKSRTWLSDWTDLSLPLNFLSCEKKADSFKTKIHCPVFWRSSILFVRILKQLRKMKAGGGPSLGTSCVCPCVSKTHLPD